jgi:hypothetical protein
MNGLNFPRYLRICRRWIRRCTRGHRICNDGLSERFLPTRLLDVGTLKDQFCTLRITADLAGRKYKYMTLSHCWGSASFLKLEASNIKKFERGIALSELSKTFQDAISVTRGLGVRYLWIDALCIIQGPTLEDWVTEASRMCDVYRHSWCNISALWAGDDQQGFLKLGGSDLSFWTHINIDWNDLGSPTDWVILDQSLWTEEVAKSPLNRRAWVVQERVLPPRQLYFGRTHMLWQCHEFSSFELVPRLHYPHSHIGTPFWNNPSEDFFKPKRPSGQKESLPLWAQYVDLYSVCSLTKPEDKFIAISGLAQDIHRAMPEDEYIVGFWRSQLPYQLMWRVNVASGESKPATTSSRPSSLAIPLRSGNPAYRSPSWSWAYTDVGVISFKNDFLHDQDFLLAEIKRTKLKFTPPSHLYGQVLDAQLILTGLPIPVSHSINAGQHQLSILSSKQATLSRLYIYFDQDFPHPGMAMKTAINIYFVYLFATRPGPRSSQGLTRLKSQGYSLFGGMQLWAALPSTLA